MKKKATITFTIDAHYADVDEKFIKTLSKDFDQWLKDWAMNQDKLVPILYEPFPKGEGKGSYEMDPSARVTVKIKRDNEVILDTAWDELSDDF
jgi:hypothetical protein